MSLGRTGKAELGEVLIAPSLAGGRKCCVLLSRTCETRVFEACGGVRRLVVKIWAWFEIFTRDITSCAEFVLNCAFLPVPARHLLSWVSTF